ncbi:MAG: tyramine oxidase, partial [Chloroflexota bacterium]
MDPREGLVLYTLGYEDGERVRPILYRASLCEMVVPYADPDPLWSFRNAFDLGEYGIGRSANTLVPGNDTPENAVFFDAPFANDAGEAWSLPRAVALYERDGGLLWRHKDAASRTVESRRARELVLGFVTTIGNYDYGLDWIFYQDGTLQLQVVLTGIMLPKGVASTASGPHDRGANQDEMYG